MPASSAAAMRTRSVSRGAFMVSFSMQLTKIRPSPRFASMVLPTCIWVASASCPRSKRTIDLSVLATLNLYCLSLSLTNLALKRRSATVLIMASEICPMPPSRAASSASSAVEISTPMPPITIGTSSLLPNCRRKSSTLFMRVLPNGHETQARHYRSSTASMARCSKRNRDQHRYARRMITLPPCTQEACHV
ncbi:MAG: hypothetical protein AW09_001975 [Candidatus Accumulibacter phosphatis]|uniref:Uncharacterized protein n=1 Tax=Candidatus Accumulibacter phosphatis TaxID=327160 RepID=A0A080LW03_9PROT|nr:MAG: hypothetical protein AW09_001975 [Candidatus Accumulibacter phosphatis]